jgi:hypothetical protein
MYQSRKRASVSSIYYPNNGAYRTILMHGYLEFLVMQNEKGNKESKSDDFRTVRKVQAYTGEKSLTIVLPRSFTYDLGIQKGDYLRVEKKGKQLVLEKASID